VKLVPCCDFANCAIYFRFSIEWPWRTAVSEGVDLCRKCESITSCARRLEAMKVKRYSSPGMRCRSSREHASYWRSVTTCAPRVPVVEAGWARASQVVAIAAARTSGRNGRLLRPLRRIRSAKRRVGVRLVVAKRDAVGIAKGWRQGWTIREI